MASAIGWWAWCTGGLVTFWETLEIWKGRGSDAWEPTAAMLNPRGLDLLGVFEKYPGVLRFNHSNKPCNHAGFNHHYCTYFFENFGSTSFYGNAYGSGQLPTQLILDILN